MNRLSWNYCKDCGILNNSTWYLCSYCNAGRKPSTWITKGKKGTKKQRWDQRKEYKKMMELPHHQRIKMRIESNALHADV